jgi:hypothetical protein
MSWTGGTPPSGTLLQADIDAHGAPGAAQKKLAEYLAAWVGLAACAAKTHCITWADKGTVATDIDLAMRMVGLSVMAIFNGGKRNSAMKNAVLLRPARFTISILERPKLNRGSSGIQLPAGVVAGEVCKALEGMPLAQGQISIMDVDGPIVGDSADDDSQQYTITLESALLIVDPAT